MNGGHQAMPPDDSLTPALNKLAPAAATLAGEVADGLDANISEAMREQVIRLAEQLFIDAAASNAFPPMFAVPAQTVLFDCACISCNVDETIPYTRDSCVFPDKALPRTRTIQLMKELLMAPDKQSQQDCLMDMRGFLTLVTKRQILPVKMS